MVNAIEAFDAKHLKASEEIPDFRPGDTVDVNVKIQEGNNSRIQTFTGVVIARQGAGVRETFIVRKISFGTGVERRFPLHAPTIDSIKVVARGLCVSAACVCWPARKPSPLSLFSPLNLLVWLHVPA